MQSFSDMVNGIRPGFGEEAAAIRNATAAAVRKHGNWIMPGLMALIITVLNAALVIGSTNEFPRLITRIILFDYLLFFLGWLSGWNAARRWRNNQEFMSEMILTNLSPPVVGNLLFAGSLAIWWRCFLLVAISDIAFQIIAFLLQMSSDTPMSLLPMYLAAWIPCYLLLAWFHLESMRIAHWLFAITALPGLSLARRAATGIILIAGYVTALTILGSMITGIVFLLLMMAVLALSLGLGLDDFFGGIDWLPGIAPIMHIPALAGMALVGMLKRLIAKSYERDFSMRYLMFTWYGAGDHSHPAEYPAIYKVRAAQLTRIDEQLRNAPPLPPPPSVV